MPDERDYEVGYGKPPKASRFQKGQSGNPHGRPKGSQNVATIVEQAMRQKVQVKENGKVCIRTKLQVAVTQMVNKAAGGDLKALREANSYVREANDEREKEAQDMGTKQKVHLADSAVLRQLANRVKNLNTPNPEVGNHDGDK